MNNPGSPKRTAPPPLPGRGANTETRAVSEAFSSQQQLNQERKSMITNLKLTALTADLVKDRLEALGLAGLPSQVADQLAQGLSEDIAANAKKLARKINERHIAKAILRLGKARKSRAAQAATGCPEGA
jgi:hypothetical protein